MLPKISGVHSWPGKGILVVPVADNQQLAFDFEPDGFAYEEENEFDDSGNFADDPEFYNTGEFRDLHSPFFWL